MSPASGILIDRGIVRGIGTMRLVSFAVLVLACHALDQKVPAETRDSVSQRATMLPMISPVNAPRRVPEGTHPQWRQTFCSRSVFASFWSPEEPLPLVRTRFAEGVVLPAEAAPEILCQCSRPTPPPGTDFWTPSEQDLALLEDLLPRFVESNPPTDSSSIQATDLKAYARQYLGIVYGGRRVVYVNLFPRKGSTVRAGVVAVCDGGPDFFGVDFDFDREVFTNIDYNGTG